MGIRRTTFSMVSAAPKRKRRQPPATAASKMRMAQTQLFPPVPSAKPLTGRQQQALVKEARTTARVAAVSRSIKPGAAKPILVTVVRKKPKRPRG
jgi:hypothetical protein